MHIKVLVIIDVDLRDLCAGKPKEVPTSESKPAPPAAAQPRPGDLESEFANSKAENAAVRELLRKMEEQQKTLLEQVDHLQRRYTSGSTGWVPMVQTVLAF